MVGGRLRIRSSDTYWYSRSRNDSSPVVLGKSSPNTYLEAEMVGRPVNYQRRAELLDAAVEYAIEHGFSELSWRPVAAALGVSTSTLVHHFGTKEQMLEAILRRLRERVFADLVDGLDEQSDLATAIRAVWTRASDPQQGKEFRL